LPNEVDIVDVTKTLEREAKLNLPAQGFSREALETLSAARNEPGWMLERRYEGWYHYEEMEPPFWRRTDISKLKWEGLIPYAPSQVPVSDLDALPPKLHEALGVYGQRAGLLVQRDSAPVYLDLADELRDLGIIWTDMITAVREHPDLVQKYFMNEAVPSRCFLERRYLPIRAQERSNHTAFCVGAVAGDAAIGRLSPHTDGRRGGQQRDVGIGTALDGVRHLPRHLSRRRY
jgi:hypothetical protein